MTRRHYQAILAIAGMAIAMGIAGTFDYDEAQRQAEQYCEMVQLWKQTGGWDGWPAYDEDEACRSQMSNVLEKIAERDATLTKEQKK